MKCTIPEISWHNREPVLSVHLQPLSDKFYRLATGGADCHVLIWQLMINENGSVKLEALSDLTRHQRAVNSVRWSPTGQYLATADDDANIIIWQLKTDNIPLLEGETNDREVWVVYKIIRGHKEDIYDLCWSPNGLKLLSGSIDNTAIIWDFTKGKNDQILTDHKGFVQGVAWDPKGHYLATISTDRICRIFDSSGKQVKARISKGCLPVPEDHYLHSKDVKYFHDDTFKSFFRRLDFSPDGTLLAVPSGHLEIEDTKKIINCTLIFAVESWTSPIAVLPSGKQSSTVVRFCPILFELQDDGPEPTMSLPFRMILAIGTDHDIILYDTQQMAPFAYYKDIHYTRLTDLTWSNDGLLLVASSTDGFCALVTFEPNELGIQYIKEDSEAEESILDVSGCEELEKEEAAVTEPLKPKKLNLLEKWAIKTPKKKKDQNAPNNDIIVIEDDTESGKRKCEEDEPKVVPKRIKPIPVTEEKKVTNGADQNNKSSAPEVKKRIKPVPVSDDKKATPVSVSKSSPLLSFLKSATSKQKLIDSTKSTSPAATASAKVIADEIEARDAWQCEKEPTKQSEKEEIYTEDTADDFSLHLDDTNSHCTKTESQDKTRVNDQNSVEENETKTDEEKCVQEVEQKPIEDDASDSSSKNAVESEAKLETNLEVGEKPVEDAENCITKNDSSDISSKNTVASEAKLVINNIEDKPKRRIPLITLSSPKHKKK